MINSQIRNNVICATFYPLTQIGDIGFIKDIFKDDNGIWQVTTTKNINEAILYGGEAAIIHKWLNNHKDNYFIVNNDDEFTCSFSVLRRDNLTNIGLEELKDRLNGLSSCISVYGNIEGLANFVTEEIDKIVSNLPTYFK